ncbi:MAG: hypothetical protein IJH07_08660 [Ruminococcus sp.]|nr:hypothetical protein [Ruminococcus sp.]
MAKTTIKGNCYVCGKELTKAGAKRHLLTHEYSGEKSQNCRIVKVEFPYDKDYWLYLDIPFTSTLRSLDSFLREIWLECCGHMSAFYVGVYEEVGMSRKIATISDGSVLRYAYDFGSTTELIISFVGTITRKYQKNAVRLLVRNEAPLYHCAVCGKPAKELCCECIYEIDNPFYCESCANVHYNETEHHMLPVVNSPRMGVCGYEGEMDVYEFDPEKLYDK